MPFLDIRDEHGESWAVNLDRVLAVKIQKSNTSSDMVLRFAFGGTNADIVWRGSEPVCKQILKRLLDG